MNDPKASLGASYPIPSCIPRKVKPHRKQLGNSPGLKRRQKLEPIDDTYYYRDVRNHEVDFVVKTGIDIKELLQVTYASNEGDMKNREIESILGAGKKLKCLKLTIVIWDYENVKEYSSGKVKFVSLWRWLTES